MAAIAPRKSPNQQRSRRTVEAVLEAAAQVLEAGGLARFTTNAVAERAGVSIGSLYQYFPGKDAVMVALIRQEAARFDAALIQAIRATRAEPFEAAVSALVEVAVRHQTTRPNLATILDLEERRLGIEDEAKAAADTALTRLQGFLEARGVAEPEVAAADVLNLTRGMVDGALAADPVDLSRRVRRAVLGYLRADIASVDLTRSQPTPSA